MPLGVSRATFASARPSCARPDRRAVCWAVSTFSSRTRNAAGVQSAVLGRELRSVRCARAAIECALLGTIRPRSKGSKQTLAMLGNLLIGASLLASANYGGLPLWVSANCRWPRVSLSSPLERMARRPDCQRGLAPAPRGAATLSSRVLDDHLRKIARNIVPQAVTHCLKAVKVAVRTPHPR